MRDRAQGLRGANLVSGSSLREFSAPVARALNTRLSDIVGLWTEPTALSRAFAVWRICLSGLQRDTASQLGVFCIAISCARILALSG